MKNKMLIIIAIIVGVVLIDTIQALVFNNSPLLKIRMTNDGSIITVDKGI